MNGKTTRKHVEVTDLRAVKEFEKNVDDFSINTSCGVVIIWHVDEIYDHNALTARTLWNKIVSLIKSHQPHPKILHLIYFSGVFQLGLFGKHSPESPSDVSWIIQRPFSENDISILFIKYLEILKKQPSWKIPDNFFEKSIGNTTVIEIISKLVVDLVFPLIFFGKFGIFIFNCILFKFF